MASRLLRWFRADSVSSVHGLRRADGTAVVVKARPDDGRAAPCVAAQARLAERGFPRAQPLTPVIVSDGIAVHAEEFQPGGEVLRGASPAVASVYARVFAWPMTELTAVTVAPPLPNPRRIRWDHQDSGLGPTIGVLDERDQSRVPAFVTDTAAAPARAGPSDLPRALGHGDFEARNLRRLGQRIRIVHDWGSLTWQPEAALVGAASGTFASAGPPVLAPIARARARAGRVHRLPACRSSDFPTGRNDKPGASSRIHRLVVQFPTAAGHRYLVQGDFRAHTFVALRDNVECPAAQPRTLVPDAESPAALG